MILQLGKWAVVLLIFFASTGWYAHVRSGNAKFVDHWPEWIAVPMFLLFVIGPLMLTVVLILWAMGDL